MAAQALISRQSSLLWSTLFSFHFSTKYALLGICFLINPTHRNFFCVSDLKFRLRVCACARFGFNIPLNFFFLTPSCFLTFLSYSVAQFYLDSYKAKKAAKKEAKAQ